MKIVFYLFLEFNNQQSNTSNSLYPTVCAVAITFQLYLLIVPKVFDNLFRLM